MNAFLRVSLSAVWFMALLGQTPALAFIPQVFFEVTSTMDLPDDNLLDPDCLASNGLCTLRAAIMQTNYSNLAGTDTINLTIAGIYTTTQIGPNEDEAATGDLDITGNVNINNASGGIVVIDGGYLDRVLDVFTATVTIQDVTLQHGGNVGLAGVRAQFGATLTLEQVTVADNTGTGIRSDASTLTLNQVTLSGNTSAGLYNTGSSIIYLNNSTLANNTGANGGGLYTDGGAIYLNNTTVAGNTAFTGGGIYRSGTLAIISLQNSIVAGNSGSPGPDCNATLTSPTYSLIQNTSGCTINGGSNNLLGQDPLLGPLQNNGGPTFTRAPDRASPVINTGNPDGCTDTQLNLFATDQRGTTRPQPQGGRCDMGAYEVPAVQLASANFSVSESAGAGVITATLDGVSALTVTVPYTASNGTALAGSDYAATTGTLTFPPNALAITFTVSVLEDPLDEADETVALTLGNSDGAVLDTPLTATLTIVDNDAPPTYYFVGDEVSVPENGGPASLTVRLSAISGLTVSVNYSTTNGTALAGSDYTAASGTLTFSPGITIATFNVPIINETSYEPDETLTLNLGNAINALTGTPNTATVTILNDDSPQLFLPIIARNFVNCLAGPNESEPNGSVASADGPLCFDGRPYIGGFNPGTPPNNYDWDYYTLQWPQAGTFTVRLTGAALGAGLQLQLYYQTIGSSSLVGYSAGPVYQITCPPGDGDCTGAAGLYYILIYMPPNYSGSGYTLTVTTP